MHEALGNFQTHSALHVFSGRQDAALYDRQGCLPLRMFAVLRLFALVAVLLFDFSAHAAGTGLAGKYYTNTTFSGTAVSRTDTNLNFTWPGSPIAGVGSDNFSVAWTGQIEPEFTELYTFYLTADDAARLWVDDQCLVARTFFQGNGELRGQIRLKAGHRVNLRVEFIEFTGNASVKLEWASPSRAREIVPMARLYPTTEIPNGGSLRMEIWTNLPGASFATLTNSANYPSKPAMREFITAFECLATNWETNYGTRVMGFLRAPTNGNYTFAVSGDDVAQLFLSTTTNAAAKVLIASVTNATAFREWTNHPSQISAPIALAAGQRCYVELLHKQSANADHWSVGWMKPGDTNFSIIPGAVLMMPDTGLATPSTANYFNTLATEQPRLGATRARFTWLKQQYLSPTPSAAKTRAQAVINLANTDLTTAANYGNDMPRLALAWWLTGDAAYAERVWTRAQGIMTNGDFTVKWKGFTLRSLAYAYDWLYPYWDNTRRTNLLNFIVNSGLNSQGNAYGNNIGILNDSGFIMAALAVGTGNEAAAEPDLSQAVSQLVQKIDQWEPNAGAWLEGTDYGIFAKLGLADGMQSIETSLGSSFGISRVAGFSTARREPLTIASNTRQRFTFSDVGTGSNNPMGWANWWARRFDALEVFDFSRQVGNSAWNALLVPETTSSPASVGLNPDTCFAGPADCVEKALMQHVVTLRQNWTDSKATFIGGMGGTYMSHGMLQSGTFQLCARGVNWFVDLKSESYDVPNHNVTTPNPNGADRWDYYRNRAEGHNCLIVNPTANPDRIWNAPSAPLINFQSAQNGQRSFAVWDISKNITGVTKVQRGIQLLGQRKQVLIQDEIVHPTPTTCWWFAHFSASVATSISGDGSSVTLTSGSERLWGKIVAGGGVWTVREALPLPTSPAPAANANNTSYKKLAIQLTNVTSTTLAVWFVPLAPGENPPTNAPAITPLNTWNLVAQNDPPVARNGVATSTNNAPVDVDLRNFASDDWTYPNQLLFAVTNAQDGSVVLLPDGHTARFTPVGANPFFDYRVTDEDGQSSSASIMIGVQPVTYVWTNRASGSWSTGANWSNGIAPVSSRGNRLEFFSGQTFGGGPFTLNNNLPGTTLVNSLVLGGIASGTTTVNLTGGPLQFTANGLTAPSITLDAYTSIFSYNISNAITLNDDLIIAGDHSGTFNFAGGLSGGGGVTRTGIYGTLIFSGNNSYTGPTIISAGTLQIGNDGATGTLGSGAVLNNGQLRFDRTGSVDVPNDISGSGSVLLHCPSVNDVVHLAGDNTFTGEVRMTGGSLRVTDAAQLGSGTKNIVVDNANGALRLDGSAGDIVLPASLRLFTSNPNGAIVNLAGDNVIEGPVTLAAGAGGSRFTVSGGRLAINGVVTPNTSGRTLDLRGAANGFIFGNISDGPGANVLVGLTKNDAGSWTLGGSNAYAGATTVSAGSLVINGGLTSPSNVTVTASGRLAGNGNIAAQTSVLGLLSPGDRFGTLTIASNLTFGSASRLQWELGGNSLVSGDFLAATSVTVTNGAKVDVLLNSPGSAVNFLHALWRTNRSWPVLNATALTGAFTLGTNTTDASGRPAATYGSFSLTNTGTNVSLLWTALPGFPVIHDPTVTITTPAANPASFAMGGAPLNLAASVNAGGGSSLGVNWTYVSEDGSATFANAASPITTVEFSDEGEYLLRCTVTNEVGIARAELTVFVTPVPTWFETRIAFTNYSRTEPLTNFPVLVVLGTNVPGFSYSQFQTPDGSDLRFLDADGQTELNHEIETWNTNGSSFVWVQVPLFTNQCFILARWGDPAAVDAPAYTTNGATWSAGYVGVWHFADAAAMDATAGARHASSNSASVVTGLVGNAANYDGVSQATRVPWHSDFNLASNFEVQGWFKLAAADKPAVNNYRVLTSRELSADFNNRNWWLALRSDGRLWWKSSPGIDTTNSTDLADGAWHYFAAVHDGGAARLYVDGVQAAVDATPGTVSTPTAAVFFGNEDGTTRFHKGPLDEMRLSNVARSSNWVWAVYQNIASNSAFASFSSVTGPILSAPVFESFAVNNGQATMLIGGAAGYTYTVQASTNLLTWTTLLTTNPPTLPFTWTDNTATNQPARFYRVIMGF